MKLLKNTLLKDVMTGQVIKVYEDEEVSRAEELFIQHKVYYLPVVSRNNKLVGIITQKYLYKMQSPRRIISPEMDIAQDPDVIIDGQSYYRKEVLDSYILRHIMHKNPAKMKENQLVPEAIKYMADNGIGCITVVDDNDKILGILTSQDVVRVVASYLK